MLPPVGIQLHLQEGRFPFVWHCYFRKVKTVLSAAHNTAIMSQNDLISKATKVFLRGFQDQGVKKKRLQEYI